MPLVSQNVIAAANFDGTAGAGEVDFAMGTDRDDQRAMIQSIGLSSTVDMDTLFLRLAPSLAQIVAGEYIELAFNDAASLGVSLYGCEILVPVNWLLFAVTTGVSAQTKFFTVDWRRVYFTTKR